MNADVILQTLLTHNTDKICAYEFRLGNRRLDFWTMNPHSSKDYETVSYEIKVTKADFKQDSKEKQEPALGIANRFFYVTPKGLINKKDIPKWAGLIEVSGGHLKITKRSPRKKRDINPSWELIVNLLRSNYSTRRDTETDLKIKSFLQFDNNNLKKRLSASEKHMWEKSKRIKLLEKTLEDNQIDIPKRKSDFYDY